MEYLLHIGILAGIYVILSISLNLISGYTGLLSLGHAAFYGIGAYTVALMALRFQTPFWLNMVIACCIGGIFGAVVALPSLRVKDDYFVVATLAFQLVASSVIINWVSLTGGPMGLPGIPLPTFCGWQINSHIDFFILIFLLCIMLVSFSIKLTRSPFGRVLKAIREDEIFTQALGKNIAFYKVAIFIIGAGMAAMAGVIYAYYISFIDPTSFTLMDSIFILSIVIIGGAGNIWGSILGAVFLVVLPEALRFMGMPSAIAANMRQIIYGALLVLCMFYRPQGFMGKYTFSK
jgi:branched-chain amino acid transport system permease protein